MSSFWKERSVFVTGGTGLLGSWLIHELLRKGASVTCLIRDWVPRSGLVSSGLMSMIQAVRGELEDYSLLLRAINEYEIDTVFHLGAQTIVGTATRSALSTFESNVRGTWNLLEAAKTCSQTVQRVIVASSDKAYGSHTQLPYTEETPLQGRFPYDVSKSCADLISLSYFHTYGTPVAVTRCGNLFGGGDLNFNRLIPGTIRSALREQSPIIRSDGTFIREYFYVKDAVKAYLMLAEKLPDERYLGQAFNFGNETPLSVSDVVSNILEVMDKTNLVPTVLNGATNEIRAQHLDCAKASKLLGWRPKYTLEEGLLETASWYRAWLEAESSRESDVLESSQARLLCLEVDSSIS